MNVYEENPIIRINPLAFEESFVDSLNNEQKMALKIIIDALRIK
jgi:hypothetical protein